MCHSMSQVGAGERVDVRSVIDTMSPIQVAPNMLYAFATLGSDVDTAYPQSPLDIGVARFRQFVVVAAVETPDQFGQIQGILSESEKTAEDGGVLRASRLMTHCEHYRDHSHNDARSGAYYSLRILGHALMHGNLDPRDEQTNQTLHPAFLAYYENFSYTNSRFTGQHLARIVSKRFL